MRSIRLSLLVYFLGLLVVALTVASVLVYRSAERTLQEKEDATAELIRKRTEDRQHEELKRLDDRLLEHTLVLASRVNLRLNWGKLTYCTMPDSVNTLGIISSAQLPGGYVNLPAWLINPARVPNSIYSLGIIPASLTSAGYVSMAPWLVQVQMEANPDSEQEWRVPGRRGLIPGGPTPIAALPVAIDIWRSTVVDLNLNQHELVLPHMPRPDDYYQIDLALGLNRWGKPFRSASLENASFPGREELTDHKSLDVDDFELTPGHWVRRARLKAPRIQSVFVAPGPPRPRPRRDDRPTERPPERRQERRPDRPPPPPPDRSSDFIVVQVAAEMSRLAGLSEAVTSDRDEQLNKLKEQTAEALAGLRNRLLTISSVTFAATVLGTWWLVWLGLLPLRRMSDAVSKVSPRDFRLPLGDAPLPVELRPIAERLTAALDQLKRAFAREKQSTADISHELRTPLAAMLATTELALRKARSPEQYREFIQDCRCSAKQMNQIVERLLTLARLDAGVDRLRPQSVDVADLAEECAAVVRPLAEAQGLRLSVSNGSPNGDEPSHSPIRLTTDPDKLREVLNNLLHNAIQYNRPAGQIDLKVARDNGHVRLEVRDTGIGIAPEARDLIFERFYRADPSRTGDGMNAGLGLAIVKEYVELMGGRIAVDSAPGEGSTFRVELPATCTGSL